MIEKLKFCKVREVKTPNRAHRTDAGMDFFLPEFDDEMIKDFISMNSKKASKIGHDHISIPPHASIKIPMGIKVIVPEGYALVAFNKSGVSSKTGLTLGACVVDEGYTGELVLNYLNTSSDTVTVKPGQKCVQFLLLNVDKPVAEEITPEDYETITLNSQRGDGSFGSTGI